MKLRSRTPRRRAPLAQFAGGRRAVVDEFGVGFGVGGMDVVEEASMSSAVGGAGGDGDPLLPDEAGLVPGDQELRQAAGDPADLGAVVAGAADLGDAGDTGTSSGSSHGAGIRPGSGSAVRRAAAPAPPPDRLLVRAAGAAVRDTRPSPRRRVLRLRARRRPASGQAVAGDPQQLVPAGPAAP